MSLQSRPMFMDEQIARMIVEEIDIGIINDCLEEKGKDRFVDIMIMPSRKDALHFLYQKELEVLSNMNIRNFVARVKELAKVDRYCMDYLYYNMIYLKQIKRRIIYYIDGKIENFTYGVVVSNEMTYQDVVKACKALDIPYKKGQRTMKGYSYNRRVHNGLANLCLYCHSSPCVCVARGLI